MNAPHDFDPFEEVNRRAAEASEPPEWFDQEPPAEATVTPIKRGVPIAVALKEGDGFVSKPEKARTDETKLTKPTAEKLAAALTSLTRNEVALDEFLGEVMWTPRGAGEWRRWTDDDLAELIVEFDQLGFSTPPVDLLRRMVSMVARQNAFDSAITWINSLASHDGVARVDTFLQRYYGAADTPYMRAVSRYIWTALAARVLDPGCKADMAPVLIGKQGLGKTHSLTAMVPSIEYYAEIDLNDKSADLSRMMRGKLIGELAELSGMRSRELEAIKAFMTRRIEEWVPKFVESTKRYPRRLLFIGTSNEPQFLFDSTGNRRWLPVNVERADAAAIARDRDQLWAEGMAMFLADGIQWQDAERLAPEVHADHMAEDAWTQAISWWVESKAVMPTTTRAVLVEAMGFAERDIGRRDEMRASDVLKKLGYVKARRRVDGKLQHVWERACSDLTQPVPTYTA